MEQDDFVLKPILGENINPKDLSEKEKRRAVLQYMEICDSNYLMNKKRDDELKQLKKELEELKDRDFLLSCLEAHGVDNWCGWDDAMEMYHAGVDE